jgi:hypothetical protein
MVPNYPDQEKSNIDGDEYVAANGSIIFITGEADTDISSINNYLSKAMQNVGTAFNDLANAIYKAFTITRQSDLVLQFKKFNEFLDGNIRKRNKIHCYFLSFVLFLVAYKGILPYPCRDIRNDEIPYGFG